MVYQRTLYLTQGFVFQPHRFCHIGRLDQEARVENGWCFALHCRRSFSFAVGKGTRIGSPRGYAWPTSAGCDEKAPPASKASLEGWRGLECHLMLFAIVVSLLGCALLVACLACQCCTRDGQLRRGDAELSKVTRLIPSLLEAVFTGFLFIWPSTRYVASLLDLL